MHITVDMIVTRWWICRYYLEPGDYETDDEAELLEENFGNDGENEDGF